MTNSVAIGLLAVILGLSGLDYLLTGGVNLLFLAKKGFELIEVLAFWR